MNVSLQNKCRTCMCDKNTKDSEDSTNKIGHIFPLHTIFDGLSILDMLKASIPKLNLQQQHDSFPKNICFECVKEVKNIYQFQEKCLRTEQRINELLRAPSEYDEDTRTNDSFRAKTTLKAKVKEDVFVNEESLQSDQFINEENGSDDDLLDTNDEIDEDDEIIESCYSDDQSIDFFLDEDSDMDDEYTCLPGKTNLAVVMPSNQTTHNKNKCEKLYPCTKCKSKLKSQLSLKKHMETHHKGNEEDFKHVCTFCSRGFPNAYMLKEHLRTHSGEKPFLCSECGKGFTTASSLKQHSFRHTSEWMFSCPDCPKKFPTRTDLTSHYDVHRARPKRHICDVCGRGFPKPFLLKKHKMYHTDEKKFCCEFCAKRFFTNEKLQRHTRIHTGEKPYKCKYCEKAYCQSNELTKHVRCHLGENVYQCQLCPQRFATAKLVKEHFSAHKNDDEETRAKLLAAFHATEIKGIFCR
uniref:Protein krueppel n=1 Tax=Stomoxys calcitrans TaxID=35570 RepID=A0A1I8PWC2_STOCA